MGEAPEDFLEHWPSEVAEAWGRLRLPAPADLVLAQERQALELRRYNQELRSLREQLAPAPTATKAHPLLALIRAADAAERLLHSLSVDGKRLPALAGRAPWAGSRRQALSEALAAQVQGVQLLLDGLLESLHDAGGEQLRAQPGDPFDPRWMRAVQRKTGPTQQVLEQQRPGWRCGDELIRPADVIIGSDEESP
ncbi:MAG: nucleotide exchange factor GrpE [Planctomycetota bacterium]|nr:MAG: nucleotide exchange factor GrpE [Planctomycetota bacterium]